jgi:hypothetical protein
MIVKKIIIGISLLFTLTACTIGDTTIKRGGDNTGFKDWSVEQSFRIGKSNDRQD